MPALRFLSPLHHRTFLLNGNACATLWSQRICIGGAQLATTAQIMSTTLPAINKGSRQLASNSHWPFSVERGGEDILHHSPVPISIPTSIPIPIAYTVSHFDSLRSQSVVRKLALASAGKFLLLLSLSLSRFSGSVWLCLFSLLPFLSLIVSLSIYECAQAENALKLA